MTEGDAAGYDDPAFQRLLRRRSRLRWTFSGLLIGAYLLWGVVGVYADEFYAAPLPGSAIPVGVALAFAIIVASIAMSVIYVRLVNRMTAGATAGQSE